MTQHHSIYEAKKKKDGKGKDEKDKDKDKGGKDKAKDKGKDKNKDKEKAKGRKIEKKRKKSSESCGSSKSAVREAPSLPGMEPKSVAIEGGPPAIKDAAEPLASDAEVNSAQLFST